MHVASFGSSRCDDNMHGCDGYCTVVSYSTSYHNYTTVHFDREARMLPTSRKHVVHRPPEHPCHFGRTCYVIVSRPERFEDRDNRGPFMLPPKTR